MMVAQKTKRERDTHIHFLKIEERFYDRVHTGQKPFEVRKNDCDFQTGDTVIFLYGEDYNTQSAGYTITYVLTHEQFPDGITPGYCVFGIES